MKKLSLLLVLVLSAVALPAVENKISMVTYFPVPYVAYNSVQATQQLDIGLTPNTCNLSLGTAASSVSPLTVTDTTKVTGGALALNFADSVADTGRIVYVTGTEDPLVLGVSGYKDSADLTFKNLIVANVANFPTGTANGLGISSLNTKSLTVNGLNLFGSEFPSCAAVNPDSSGNGQLAWKELALGPSKTTKAVYLACGGSITCPQRVPSLDDYEECTMSDGIMFYRPRWKDLSQGLSEFVQVQRIWNTANATPVMCGRKEKKYECSDPPLWTQAGWDTSNCSIEYDGATTTFQSCSDYLADASNPGALTGWVIEGDVLAVKHITRDERSGECETSLTLDASRCRGAKFFWEKESDSSNWTDFTFTYLPQGQYAGYYTQSGLEFHWGSCAVHEDRCHLGFVDSTATCSSSSDVGHTAEEIYREQASSNPWKQCRVGFPSANGFQELVSGISPYQTIEYKCRKKVNKCIKKCQKVTKDEDKYVQFVNSLLTSYCLE